MNLKHGLTCLNSALKQARLTTDSIYLDFIGWERQLLESVANERRFGVLEPQEQAHRERILRELDRLALEDVGMSFFDLCESKITSEAFQPLSHSNVTHLQTEQDSTALSDNTYALLIG